MNIIKASTRFALVRAFTRPSAIFRNSNWKERDEAAEKVYISQKESNPCSSLRVDIEETVAEGRTLIIGQGEQPAIILAQAEIDHGQIQNRERSSSCRDCALAPGPPRMIHTNMAFTISIK